MAPNKTLVYKKVPTAIPVAGEHLAVEDIPIDIESAPSNGIIVKLQYASLDPYMRGKMRDPSIPSYAPAFQPGQGMANACAGTVLKSNNPEFPEGTTVIAFVPIAQYARIEDVKAANVRKIDNPNGLDLALFLGPLGMPGLTAWSGLHKIGKPQKGETIFVSSASGAVGQIVGQIAKREGLTVIGSVGSDEKLEFITKELGYDAGFNYKKESPSDALKRLAPNGIDINFENVGGDHLEAAISNMNVGGRIIICGMIQNYNTPVEEQKGIRNLIGLIKSNITMEGFLVGQPKFGPVYFAEHQKNLQQWIKEGSVKVKMHTTDGVDKAAEAFLELFEGKNFGKAVLKI